MKILLAGPGTGKTSKVKTIIDGQYAGVKDILVLSFTNATVNDLIKSFAQYKNVKCLTLHSYALIINHLTEQHILDNTYETPILERFSESQDIEFGQVCYFLQCITFDGMIKACLEFLKTNPAYGKEKIGALGLLIVDEFQDFNATERELVYELAKYSNETLILGDDDQSIYGFKDADPLGIIELYGNSAVEKIEHENKCYRCPDIVVDFAKILISKNVNRIDKPWIKTSKAGQTEFIQILSQNETNIAILQRIQKIKAEDPEASILILSPVRYYVQELIELLNANGMGVVDYWAEKITPDDMRKIWWLRAIYTDRKILNMTFIANTSFTTHFKKKYNTALRAALQTGFNESVLTAEVADMFPEPFKDYILDPPPFEVLMKQHEEFLSVSGFLDYDNLERSLRLISKKLSANPEFDKKLINVMSIHKSKGLEADCVFITGLVEGVLPNKVQGLDTIEAQRRLLFVGMTRAMKHLFLISQVEWEGKHVFKMDKSQFMFNYKKKTYAGKASNFIGEMTVNNKK